MTEVLIDGNKKDNLTFKLRKKVNKVYLEYNSLFLCNLRKMKCNKLVCNIMDL